MDLLSNAFGGLDSSLAQRAEQQRLDSPGDSKLDAYIDRLLAGADPEQLKAEMRNDPDAEVRAIFGNLQTPPSVSPQGMVPDLHPQGGLQAPGAVNPAGGPGPYQPVQRPMAPSVPAQNQQTHLQNSQAIGGWQPGRSLADAPGPFEGSSALIRGHEVQGLGSRDASILMAQPTQGAPQVTPEQAGARVLPPSPPAQPRQAPPAPAQQAGRTIREQQRLMPLIPAMEAARSREAVAKTGADTKRSTEQSKNLRLALAAVAKQRGLDEDRIQRALIATEGMDDKMQIAYFKGIMDLQAEQVRAGATLGAAKTRTAGSGDDQRLKELSRSAASLRAQIARYAGADRLFVLPDIGITLGQAQQDLAAYERELRTLLNVDQRPDPAGPVYQPPQGTQPVPLTGVKAGIGKNPPPKAKGGPPPATGGNPSGAVRKQYNSQTNTIRWLDSTGKVVKTEPGPAK